MHSPRNSNRRWPTAALSFVFLLTLGLANAAWAQSNPTAQALPYTQNFSSLTPATVTTLPAGWASWQVANPTTSYATAAASADKALTASGTAASTTGAAYNFLDKPGYLNSGSFGGALALAVNTTGQRNVTVSYDIMTIRNPYDGSSNTRICETTLQYRVGTTGSFTSLTGVEYQNNTTLQTSGTTGQKIETKTITLPSACENQANVQLRWTTREVSGGGSRPSVAIDNVSVTGGVNGTIASGEYGTHTNGSNQQSSATGTWYMTWDANYLYVGVTGTNTTEGAILYLDKSPATPINGGSNSDGTLVGNNYDGSNFAALPFRADLAVYFKDGYREYRTADGANGWSTTTTSFGSYASASGTREIAIPWSAIGGQPSAFNWFGYVAYAGGGAYASVPTENPGSGVGTVIGSSARWERYYTVSTTSTLPFSRNSYVFNNTADETGFGAISVYDFTMSSAGQSITRGSGAWTIGGNLRVDNGSVLFGSTTDAANVTGNVTIGSGGTLTLSSAIGGDLNLNGSWSNSGTFNCASRAVGFNGSSAQTMTGATTFDYLGLNNAAGLTLANDATVNSQLTLTNGKVTTGANTLTLGASASVSGAGAGKYVYGNLAHVVGTGASTPSFDIGDASNYTPVSVAFGNVTTQGTLTASTAVVGGAPPVASGLSQSKYVNRKWTVSNSGTAFDQYNATLNYVPGDLVGSPGTLVAGKLDGSTWTNPSMGSPGTNAATATGMTSFSDFYLAESNNLTITASAGSGGSISPSGAVSVASGSNQTFTITHDTGYHVTDVTVDGGSVGAVSTYTFNNVTANHTIAATFAIDTFTLTYTAGAGGSISGTSPQTVDYNTSGTAVTALPSTGYHFVSWSDGVLTASRTDANVTADVTVTANFAIDTFTLTYTAGAGGSISGTSPQTVNYGAHGTAVTATPDAGHHFVSWSDGNLNATRADSTITADLTVSASFAVNTYTLTYTAGAGGSISGTSPQTVNYNTSGTAVTALPSTGYHFVSWSDGVLTASRTDANVTDDVTVTANFAIDTFTLTYTAGAGGSISGTSPQTVDYDASGTAVTAVPNTGYHFVSWSDGVLTASRTDANVTADVTVTANFAIDTYTIAASAGAGGSITPTGSVSVNHGANQAFTIAASAHYQIADVLVDGISQGAISSYTFTNVTANGHTIAASFAPITYTITASAGSNGSISPNGAVSVNEAASQTFDITPDTGYSILDVLVDGVTVGPVSTYTFTNVAAAHTIAASFTATLSAATISANSPSGTLSSTTTSLTVPVTISRTYTNANRLFHVVFQLAGGLTLTGGTAGITEGSFLTSGGGSTDFHVVDNGGGSYTVDGTVLGVPCNVTALSGTLFNVAVSSSAASGTGTLTLTSTELRDCDNNSLPSGIGTAASVNIDNTAPTVAVTSPNGSEFWAVASTHAVTWTASDDASVASIDLAYSTDGGATYPNTIASGLANTGSYTWTIPAALSSQVRVRATAHDVNGNTASDASDADFTIGQWTIAASAGSHGTIAPSGTISLNDGANQTFDFTADDHYHVAAVIVDGVNLGALASHTFSNVTANHTIHVDFASDQLTITASAGDHGSITPSGDVLVDYGQNQRFHFTPDAHYHVSQVLVDSAPVPVDSAYTFENVALNHTIAVSYALDTYTLAYATDGHGTISGTTPQTVGWDLDGTAVTAVPNTGYHFVSWSDAVTTATRQDTHVVADLSVTANFAINQYTVAVSTVGSGSATKTPDQALYDHGTPVTLEATAAPGWTFAGWSGDTTATTNPLVIPAIGNRAYVATFTHDEYTLTLNATNGSVSKDPDSTSYHYGTEVSLTATPATGYHFVSWSGDASGSSNPVVVTMDQSKSVTANFAINQYAVAVSTVGSGSATKTPDQALYDHGTPVTLEATAAPGWTFAGWSGDTTATTNPLVIPAIGNRAYVATFTHDEYTLTLNATNGSVSKDPDSTSYHYGTEVSLTATPATGYHFVSWSGDASGSSNPVVVTMDQSKSVTATFAINQYALNVTYDGNGSVVKTPDQALYDHGTDVSLEATTAAGWTFAGWSGDASGSTNPLTVSMTSAKSITAIFTHDLYTLTLNATNGSITKDPDSTSYHYGTLVSLTAVPATGYHFVSWSGAASGSSNPVVVTMDQSKSVTANFAINQYALDVTYDGSGSVVKTPDQALYDHGTDVSLEATAAAGWTFAGWSGDASGSTNPLTVSMTSAKSITAIFTHDLYTLTLNAAHGSVAKDPDSTSYHYGTTVSLTATPATGYHFVSWSDGATGSSNPVVVTMDQSKSVTANFAIDVFTVSVSAGANGSVSPNTPQSVNYGDNFSFTATPDAGYHIVSVMDGTTDLGTGGSYMLTNVTADHTIVASFAINVYTITASAGAHGSITPAGAIPVTHGAAQGFTIAADAHYHVDDVLVDGASVGRVSSYAFSNVTANHTIAASFAANPAVPALTALAAAQVKTGNDADGTTKIAITFPAVATGSTVQVYRAGYGNYPEYDDAPSAGSVPSLPTYPPSAPWTLTDVSASGQTDEVASRDFTYFVAFVTDSFGTVSPVSNLAGGVLNYHLGDVTDNVTPGHGNNVVDIADISLLGSHYGITGAGVTAYDYLDVGPTTNRSVDGRPITDNLVDFEDLVMFAINYMVVSQPQMAARPVATATDEQLLLDVPSQFSSQNTLTTRLQLKGSGAALGLSAKLKWDPAVVRVVSSAPGELSDQLGAMVLSGQPGVVDVATMGVGSGLAGEGTLATVTFERIGAGDPGIELESVDARDAANHRVSMTFHNSVPAPAVPAVTSFSRIAPNPFRTNATLSFGLARGGNVELALFSVDGRLVRHLVRGTRDAGVYSIAWDGRDDSGSPVAAGVYYARLVTPQGSFNRSLVYLK